MEIYRVTRRVPKDFVEFNNALYDWDEFKKGMDRLEAVAKAKGGQLETRDLHLDTRYWSQLGVLEIFHISDTDGYGGRLEWELVRPGPNYKQLIAAWTKLEKDRRIEADKIHLKRRRRELRAELTRLK